MSLSALSDELAQVRTKKPKFLTQMDRIIPWGEWIALIRPCYYKGERGNKPYDLERMLRIYMIQNLYNLSDMSTDIWTLTYPLGTLEANPAALIAAAQSNQ